jgi:small subunit ribosomal protein S13
MEKTTQNSDFRHIVRIGGADLDGNKQLQYSLRKIKGVNHMIANAICTLAKLDKVKKAGDLSDADIVVLNSILKDPRTAGIPAWALNRRFDPETGENTHLFSSDIGFTKENDIKSLRKIKSYKGFRHQKGLPVRGQRTQSNFRRNKGKSLGVSKKK